jgi:hypothetical protein
MKNETPMNARGWALAKFTPPALREIANASPCRALCRGVDFNHAGPANIMDECQFNGFLFGDSTMSLGIRTDGRRMTNW